MLSSKILIAYTKSIGMYFAASTIPMLLNVVSNPLIAMNMSPKDYAITGYYGSFCTLITPLVLFFMMNYYIKSYYILDDYGRIQLKATIFKALIYFSAFISVISCIGLVFYLKLFNCSSEIPISPYVYLSVFALPLTGIYTLILCDFRISRQNKKYFNLSVICGVVSILITLLLVVVFKFGATGKLAATFIANFIIFIWCCWYYRALFKIKFDYSEFKIALKFCAPLTFAAMLGFFANGFDRILLEKLGNITELGYYVVGVQMAGYISIFSTALSATFQPDIYESIANKRFRTTAKFAFLLVGCVAFFVMVFIIFAPWLIKILTAGRYMPSLIYARIIALSAISSTLYYAISQVTMAIGKTMITLTNKIISTLLIIVLFTYAIRYFGFLGAAWSLVISFLIQFVGNILLLMLSNKKAHA